MSNRFRLFMNSRSIFKFRIAGLLFYVFNFNSKYMRDEGWEKFFFDTEQTPEIELHIIQRSSMKYQIEKYSIPEGGSQVFRYDSDVLVISQDWRIGFLLEPQNPSSLHIFTNHIFYSRAIYHKMIQCHSALVDWNGSGILFLGPSGIGKTTQAECWAKYRGADIVNGDLVFVQQTEKGFIGWGTPWHGSSPYCVNRAVPLKALVVLKQYEQNQIRILDAFEKVSEVSQNIFYPTWLEEGMQLCTEVLNNLLTQLPVYRLDNRADEEAVELLERELSEKNK